MGGATKNIKLPQTARKVSTISSMFNKQTKLEPPNLLFDDEILEFINYRRRPYTVRDRINHIMMKWDDHDFKIRFRLSKPIVEQVLALRRGNISEENQWNCAISSMDKLLLTLQLFYATGSFLITAGDFLGVC